MIEMIRLNEKCQKFIPLASGISLLCQKVMLLPSEALILTTVSRKAPRQTNKQTFKPCHK
jgi:hypothetical protein